METTQVMDMYNRLVAKCWADPAFKARLLANPAETLKAEGVELPTGIDFRIVENTPNVQFWVLPMPPKDADELDDELLSRVSGGSGGFPAHGTPEWYQAYHNAFNGQTVQTGSSSNSTGTQYCA